MKLKKTLFAALAVVILATFATGWYVWSRAASRFDALDDVRIFLPRGSDEAAVADTLASALGPFGADAAWLWRMMRHDAARAHGSYVVKPGMSALAVGRMLRSGAQTPVRLTFNNVRTIGQLADRVASRMEWGSDEFLAACDSVLGGNGFTAAQYPAAFLPDTYEFFWTASPATVVSRLSAVRDRFWNDDRRSKAASLGLTPVQVATLASIVEEETVKSDERPAVARLYLNRLRRGMPLQADPTVKFALGDFSLRRIYKTHLAVRSPYNTYLNPGLPPGPIRIPDGKTIDAVLDAPAHDYIYMCAKDDFSGYHSFAVDLAAHNANAARYHRALSRRNIR